MSAVSDLSHVLPGRRKPLTTQRAALCAAVFLAAFLPFRFSQMLFTVSDLLFVISFCILLLNRQLQLAPLGRTTSLWYVAALMLFGGLLVSSLMNGDPVRGFIVVAQYAFAYVLLMWLIVREDDLDAVRRLAIYFVLGILVIDAHGIFVFNFVGYVPTPGPGPVTGGGRLATLIGDANAAAAINALAAPLVLYLWQSGTLKAPVILPALSLMVVTVILTSSNSGLIACVFSLVVFTGLSMNRRMYVRILICVAIGVVVFYYGGTALLPQAFQERVLGALTTGNLSEAGTFVDRLALIEEAQSMIAEHGFLFLGLGADQYRVHSVQGVPVHNVYFLIWTEGGLIALLGWLLFFGISLFLGLVARTRRESAYEGVTLITVVLVFLLFAMFNPHIYSRDWLTPIVLGLSLVMNSWRASAARR